MEEHKRDLCLEVDRNELMIMRTVELDPLSLLMGFWNQYKYT